MACVDEFGNHRTDELENIFQTQCVEGRQALLDSLEYINNWVGGMDSYIQLYPVTIIPPKPAFPQLKIIGIENIASKVYRVLDSKDKVYQTDESLKSYIQRTGKLPVVPEQKVPVLREKPHYHWCSYGNWDDPESSREGLQILPEWSDCELRATLLTSNIKKSAYVVFNGDRVDPTDSKLSFYKYFYEPLAQDHPEHSGGGSQIGVEGEPRVELLEQWDKRSQKWERI